MEINQVITKIKSENHGFYIIETSSFNLDAIEECIKNSFYEKQYEIDTSFINLAAEDGTKHISIEQIRKLKREFLHTNVLNISRVILISEINTLNNNSINALLKLIEEIPSNTFFIFCTSNLLKIPETIISRARLLRLNDYQDQSNLDLLASDMTNQNQNIPENVIQNIIDPFLKLNFNNKKLYKYLYELHSSYINDIDESIKFNTLTNDLIAIYFTRLNSNLIKYAK